MCCHIFSFIIYGNGVINLSSALTDLCFPYVLSPILHFCQVNGGQVGEYAQTKFAQRVIDILVESVS